LEISFELIREAGLRIPSAIEALNIIYYFDSEIKFIAIFFIITPIIANSLGEKAIIKCNLLITPIIIIVLFIAFLSVSPLNVLFIFVFFYNYISKNFFLCSYNLTSS